MSVTTGGSPAGNGPGAAEVKSLWSASGGLHTRYTEHGDNGWQMFAQEPNPKSVCVRGGGLNSPRPKVKSLVITNQHVVVKGLQALHTPPITLEAALAG